MPILRIEHAVPDFSGWKRAFDSDPADRKGSGVRRYHVMRSVEDPNYVMIDLEFDSLEDAEGLLAKMRRVWSGDGQRVMRNPQARIVDTVEVIELWGLSLASRRPPKRQVACGLVSAAGWGLRVASVIPTPTMRAIVPIRTDAGSGRWMRSAWSSE